MAAPRPRRPLPAALAALLSLGVVGTAHAQWRLQTTTAGGNPSAVPTATVRNDHGMALTVKRAPDGAIWGELDTESALEQPHPESCPSLGIDAEPLEAMGAGEDGCQIDGARIRFLLGRVADAAVRSRALVGLANGSRVVLVYHVEGLGYREAWFTLRNSKQALSAAIGAPVLEPGAD